MPEDHEVVIVGGGPAGTACALECHDIRLDYVLLEAGDRLGGQLADAPNSIRNLPAGRFTTGSALQEALEEAATVLGDRRRTACPATVVDLVGRRLVTGDGEFVARAIVLATGTRRRRLVGVDDGAYGGDVTYLVEDKLDRFAGRTLAVVGGGDSASLDALALAATGSRVYLIHRGTQLRARPDIVRAIAEHPGIEDVAGVTVEGVVGDDALHGVVVVDGDGVRRTIDIERLVAKVGYSATTELVAGQLALDETGAIVTDRDLATSVAGVFAAGDVVSGAYARVATAMGDGVRAAASILRYLSA